MKRELLARLQGLREQGTPVALVTRFADGAGSLVTEHAQEGDLSLGEPARGRVLEMLTADQMRARLRSIGYGQADPGLRALLGFLEDILPPLVDENARLRRALVLSEASRGVPYSEDAGRRYGGRQPVCEGG